MEISTSQDEKFSTFFLVVPPGFELFAFEELYARWCDFFSEFPFPEVRDFNGGLEFEAPLEVGVSFNYLLKMPTRIVLRLGHFEAFEMRQVTDFVRAFDWASWLARRPQIQVSSRSSELSQINILEKSLEREFQKMNFKNPKAEAPTLSFRFFRDQCEVSLDTSGEFLFRRGQKLEVSEAGIRENIAACLLRALSWGSAAPDEGRTLLDPMCGAGTFLIEALGAGLPQDKRAFAFQDFPCLKDYKKTFTPFTRLPHFSEVVGQDNNAKAVQSAKNNLKHFHEANARVMVGDSLKQLPEVGPGTWAIVNPPYGHRLGNRRSEEDANRLMHNLTGQTHVTRVGFLAPRGWRLNVDESFQLIRFWDFSNGGLDVRFTLWLRSSLSDKESSSVPPADQEKPRNTDD